MDKWCAALIALLIVLLVIRSPLLHPTFSDEAFYFNVARQIAEGKLPYRDFFFAHPPFHAFFLATLFRILGTSYTIAKFLTLVSSAACVALFFLIANEINKRARVAFFASLLFVLTPPFLAFSLIGHGVWEAMLFFLLGIYLIFKDKLIASSLSFLAALFFRYLTVLYFPLLLLLLWFRKQRIMRFLAPLLVVALGGTGLIVHLFGIQYLLQTVSFQLTKISFEFTLNPQFLNMGFMFLLLASIATFVALSIGHKLMLLFALFPLLIDFYILTTLGVVYYHYFLLSVPIYLLAISVLIGTEGHFVAKIFMPLVVALFIIFNWHSIDYYLNPANANKFYEIATFVQGATDAQDPIFGEPIMTNYVSLVTGRKIAGDYLDSYIESLSYRGEEKVVNDLRRDKPIVWIEMKGYFSSKPSFKRFIARNYRLVQAVEDTPTYLLYRRL